MKYTLAIALLLGSISAVQFKQRFIDFDQPDAGALETSIVGKANGQKEVSAYWLDKGQIALGKATIAAQGATDAHGAAVEARGAATKAAEERKGTEEERVAADMAAQAAISAEEGAREAMTAAINKQGTEQANVDRKTWDDDNATAFKSRADADLAAEKARIENAHKQWEFDMDDDRSKKRTLDSQDSNAWLEYVKDRDNSILQSKQAALALDKFHQAMQAKMDAQFKERSAYIAAQNEAVIIKARASGAKEDAFWDAKFDAIDAGLQTEYQAEQNARLLAHQLRKSTAVVTDNAESWASSMPEHVLATHDASSSLVQDNYIKAGGAAPDGDADSKMAKKLKDDAAIAAVKA